MSSRLGWFTLCLGLAALSFGGRAGAVEQKIALDQVPEAVKKAALEAVKGIVLTKAEKETKGSTVVYEVEGKVGSQEYEVKVSEDGKVLKVEQEDDDDGPDDGPDDDEDDDDDGPEDDD